MSTKHIPWAQIPIQTHGINKGERIIALFAFTGIPVDLPKLRNHSLFYLVETDTEVIARNIEAVLVPNKGFKFEKNAELFRVPKDRKEDAVEEVNGFVDFALDALIQGKHGSGDIIALDTDSPVIKLRVPDGISNHGVHMAIEHKPEMQNLPSQEIILTALGFHEGQIKMGDLLKDETTETVGLQSGKEGLIQLAQMLIKTPEMAAKMVAERPDLVAKLKEATGIDVTPGAARTLTPKEHATISPISPIPEADPTMELLKGMGEQELIKKFGKKKVEALAKKIGYTGTIVNKRKAIKHVRKTKAA